jgi:hypothetical protein
MTVGLKRRGFANTETGMAQWPGVFHSTLTMKFEERRLWKKR